MEGLCLASIQDPVKRDLLAEVRNGVEGVVGMGPLTRQMEMKRRHRVRNIIRQQAVSFLTLIVIFLNSFLTVTSCLFT
jgi:hypothetical protein